MKRHYLYPLTIVAGAAAFAFLAGSSAFATCGAEPNLFAQYIGPECFNYVVSPGVNTVGSIESSFWSFGNGNPNLGAGHDNGGWNDDEVTPANFAGWLRPFGIGSYMSGTWADSGEIDGCITGTFGPGKTVEIMLVAFSDRDAGDTKGFYAVAGVVRDVGQPSATYDFCNDLGGANIDLVEIPKPNIIGSTRVSSTQTDVVVQAPNLAPGAYIGTGTGLTVGDMIKGYKVYRKVVARGGPAPASRDRTGPVGWTDATGLVALGTNATVSTTCSSDSDVYLATSVVFDSNFETRFLSANSTRVECGPNIAEPPRFKIIDKDKGKQGPIKPRTRR